MDEARSQSLVPQSPVSGDFALLQKKLANSPAWELRVPDGSLVHIGQGSATFGVEAANDAGLKALKSLDELEIAKAYLNCDLNLHGDFLAALSLRSALLDAHPLARLWTTRVLPLLRGQVAFDKKSIEAHYDEDPAFFEAFLDRKYRCYSQAEFVSETDTLETAIERKLNSAVEATGLVPGARVLDIGAGWGAFVEFAGRRGIQVTSLTISAVSERYVNELIARLQLPCEVVREHLMEYRCSEPFDAIVNLGVTEHLPDYPATLRQYERLLKPGGRIYLDASASRTPVSTVTASLIYPGNHRFLDIAEYVNAVQNSCFDLMVVGNDSESYRGTIETWARNLENAHDFIVQRFGERQYRRFRLYLWAATHALITGDLEAYHLVLKKQTRGKA
jgi:cyclopropane-fatty-acyl-phospholipid synthase